MRPVLAGLAVQAAGQAPAHEMTAPVGGCGIGRDDDRGAAAGPGLQRPVDDAVVLRGHHSDGVTQALLEHGDQGPRAGPWGPGAGSGDPGPSPGLQSGRETVSPWRPFPPATRKLPFRAHLRTSMIWIKELSKNPS